MRNALHTLEEEIGASGERLLNRVSTFNNEDLRNPSLLPGWSRGHVVTHLARNADSLVNLLTWARTGVETPQYPSGEVRDAEIEAGCARPAKVQLADLEEASARFAQAVQDMPEDAWRATVRGFRGNPHPAWYLLVRRARELEFHHADLGAGYGPGDWPEPFVSRELAETMLLLAPDPGLSAVHAPDRSWTGLGDGPAITGSERDLLAWLSGRSDGSRLDTDGPLPAPPPWMTGTAPPDLPPTPPETYLPKEDT